MSDSISYSIQTNNSVSNSTDIIYHPVIQAIVFIGYILIFLIGLFGNAIVCYVVARNRTMQTVTNLFITNLALSDILLCLFAVPFTPLYTFLGKWAFGGPLCHLMPYAQGCSVYISTLTLTSIAVDRFFVIIYPFRRRMDISTCLILIASIWVFALLVTLPYGYYMNLNEMESIIYCEEEWPSDDVKLIFSTLTTILQFVIPFIVMAFCYTCVSIKLSDRLKTRPGSKNTRKEDAERERKKRTNRMLIAMVAIFGLSWLPLNLVNIGNDFYSFTAHWEYNMLLFYITHLIAMSSTCYNPFLYAWLNENFRKEFKQILPCLGALVSKRPSRKFNQSERTDMFRSERACNGNETTIQESLLTSVVHKGPNVKYAEEFNDGSEHKTKLYEGLCNNISTDEKLANNSQPNDDGGNISMYMFSEQTGAVAVSDKDPIVSAL